jgi:hypothetical protein
MSQTCQQATSFDHLVGGRENDVGPSVRAVLRLITSLVGRMANGLFAFENAAGVSARDAEKIVV